MAKPEPELMTMDELLEINNVDHLAQSLAALWIEEAVTQVVVPKLIELAMEKVHDSSS